MNSHGGNGYRWPSNAFATIFLCLFLPLLLLSLFVVVFILLVCAHRLHLRSRLKLFPFPSFFCFFYLPTPPPSQHLDIPVTLNFHLSILFLDHHLPPPSPFNIHHTTQHSPSHTHRGTSHFLYAPLSLHSPLCTLPPLPILFSTLHLSRKYSFTQDTTRRSVIAEFQGF